MITALSRFFKGILAIFLWAGLAVNCNAETPEDYRSLANKPLQSSPNSRSFNRNSVEAWKAAAHNRKIKESLANRGGFVAIFANLALGGMVGSLIFDGAFEHLNFFDLTIFAVIGILLYYTHKDRFQSTPK